MDNWQNQEKDAGTQTPASARKLSSLVGKLINWVEDRSSENEQPLKI